MTKFRHVESVVFETQYNDTDKHKQKYGPKNIS